MKGEFKDTKIGRIPIEWNIYRLKELVENESDIVAGPFGSNLKVSDYRMEGVPIIRLQNIERNKFKNMDIKYTSPEKAKELEYHSYPVGDLVLAKLGDPIGKTCLVPEYMGNGLVVADVVRIRLSPNKADKYFMEYLLNSRMCITQLEMETIGSTRPRVNISQVRDLEVPVPPLPEQKKIAEVLTTIDEAIVKNDEAIEKTQRIKKGLMQQLLMRGIGHKEFQETEIGMIPKEWDVGYLGDIATLDRGKFAHRPRNDPRFYGGKYPFIQTGDISEAKGIVTKYSQTLNEDGIKISRLFKKGTLVITIAGNIGDIGILNFDSYFPDSIVGITPVKTKIHSIFLVFMMTILKGRISSIAPRSTQKNINLEILKKVKLPLPPLFEQKKIADILSVSDKKIELFTNRKTKLERIKKGFMNELLTGKKRVKLDS